MINCPYYYQEDFFSHEEIIDIHELLSNNKISKDGLGTEYKKVESFNCELNETYQFLNKINQRTHWINNTEFGYDLYSDYVRTCNLNYYHNDENEYDWHVDSYPHGHKNDMKVTVLINLSLDKFTGGKFFLNPGKIFEVKELEKPGSAIWFPSHTNHKVEPVTSGKRTSVSFWFSGPGFK